MASVTIVNQGETAAVVVIAESPSLTAAYAAEEFVHHVEKATGARLAIHTEAADLSQFSVRVYVGDTHAARKVGIAIDELPLEASLLQTIDNDIYVVGREDAEADPLHEQNQYSGTLFGVYELLERYVGVRWLWPGALGTYVPRLDALSIDDLDEVIQPAIEFRRMRWRQSIEGAIRRYRPENKQLAFSDEGLEEFAKETAIFLRRHRMGTRLNREQYVVHGRVSHNMKTWWQEYGKEHPEFFMMDESGRRGHYSPNSMRVDPCMSNPDLHRFIVDEIWDGGDVLRLGAKDHYATCQCENCLAWDEPHPNDAFMTGRIVSNRYARFYNAVYELAKDSNPNVEIIAYIYMGYFPAPSVDIQLDQNVYLEFCPWGQGSTIWFPTDPQRLAWMKRQWLGWKATGAKLGYRPNWELGGYVMPHISTRQGGEFFKFAYEHGMTTVCMSYRGQFATRGPEHYMYARLYLKPELSINEIKREYYSAFGPAAKHVETYFDFWEQHNHRLLSEGRWNNMWSSPATASQQYSEEIFAHAERLLDRALREAVTDSLPEYAQRVEFLQTGLMHAKLAVQMVDAIQGYINDPGHAPAAQQAIHDLVSFRRAHEGDFISNYLSAVRIERRQYGAQIDQLTSGQDIVQDRPRFDEYEAVQVPAFLAHTDVGPYLGHGWYRNTFSIPGHRLDRPVEIRFGAVDEQAWVYVNGKLVGEHTAESEGRPAVELWNVPFVITVEPEDLVDGENLLIVRMHASDGNAGIHKPVEVYQDGGRIEFAQSWEFRKDPDNIGVEDGWYSMVPGEDAYR
ncbi:DUF4838 domain-containing protein [Phycisphaerales bacterium AB-hyl4]|uniref:DUF4838 domain-containing protein n=1 Tax=Natronomicrosphaera hydrolytica TaxID=3242702 RepID=A0ABV4UAH3_9BACT